MGSKVEYVESSHMYATNYVRNSKAIGVLWGVFSICYAIIVAVAFATPEWLGDPAAVASDHSARFGLFARCYYRSSTEGGPECQGGLDELLSLPSIAWRAAAVLVALAALMALLAVAAMLLFFFLPATSVFRAAAWIQLLSAATLCAGVAAYPAGWDAPEVKLTCGTAAGRYEPGGCRLRWAFLLAAVGCLDAAVLAALAFILAARHVRLQAEPGPTPGAASLYKGEVNNGFVGDAHSVAGSRKSLNLHPVLLMPGNEADRFSEFSGRTAGGRSKSSAYRGAEYAPSIQNFQLPRGGRGAARVGDPAALAPRGGVAWQPPGYGGTAARRERVAPVVRARRGAVLRRRVLAAHWPAVVRHGALQRPVRRAALQAAQLHLLLRPAHPAQRPPHPRGARPAAVQDPRAGDALRESRYSELQHGAASGVDSGDGPCGPRPRRVLARDQQAAARARLHAARAQPRPRRELQVGLPARAQPVLPAPLHRHEGAPQAVRRRRSLQRPTQGGLESPQQVARPRAVRTAVRERLYARGASRQHDRPQEDHAGERVREHARALRLQRGERLRPRAPLPPALLLRRAPLVGRALLHDARGQVTAAPRLR